jgi:CBS-domain-containing membrane protein
MTKPTSTSIDDEETASDATSVANSDVEVIADIERQQQSVADLTAADVMSAPVVSISVRNTLWDAWNALYNSGLRHLVVLDGNRCVGVIDDRRIALEWPLGPTRELGRPVGRLLPDRARSVLAETPISDLARIMLRDRVDVLPVVTSAGEVIGLVTASDLLLVLAFQNRSG